jgi:hypothetical protein
MRTEAEPGTRYPGDLMDRECQVPTPTAPIVFQIAATPLNGYRDMRHGSIGPAFMQIVHTGAFGAGEVTENMVVAFQSPVAASWVKSTVWTGCSAPMALIAAWLL